MAPHIKNTISANAASNLAESQEIFSFTADAEMHSINQNITSLDELQTLSDLAEQLQNTSSSKRQYLTDILLESQTLLIHGLTDNLNETEKSEAASLIANILTMNPYLEKLFLDDNHFSNEDLAKILNATHNAHSNPLLQTRLSELHLRGTVNADNIADLAPKLLALHKHGVFLELEYDVTVLLEEKQAIMAMMSYQKGCDNYLNYLSKNHLQHSERFQAVRNLLNILQGDEETAIKTETFMSDYQRFKMTAQTTCLSPRENALIKKIAAKSNLSPAKSHNNATFFAINPNTVTATTSYRQKKLKL